MKRVVRGGLTIMVVVFLLGLSAIAVLPAPAQSSAPRVQIVSPGQSIQAAIDKAPEGGVVMVQPGNYEEWSDSINGLTITRSLHLLGLSTAGEKVVLKNAGTQRNGIVAVPPAHTNCVSCHSSLAPPFPLLPHADRNVSTAPVIHDLSITGITIEGFLNNGLFTRNVKNFRFVDVHAVGNKNYGIFPTLSEDGLIAHCSASGADDSGIWIETSKNVTAIDNLAEDNIVGIEISNSEDILVANNEARGNSVGLATLFLPHIFDQRPDIQRITIINNRIHNNNKVNGASPGTLLSLLPSGVGIFHLGGDDSTITGNIVEHHYFVGIAIVDYCAVAAGGPRDCSTDPQMRPGFLLDSVASENRVLSNYLQSNGAKPDPAHPFALAASDIALLSVRDNRNCFTTNTFTRYFSTLGRLPECQEQDETRAAMRELQLRVKHVF